MFCCEQYHHLHWDVTTLLLDCCKDRFSELNVRCLDTLGSGTTGIKQLCHYITSLMNLLENTGLKAEHGAAGLSRTRPSAHHLPWYRTAKAEQDYLKKQQINSNWLLG